MQNFKKGDWVTATTVVGTKQGIIEDMTVWNVLFRPFVNGRLQDVMFIGLEKVSKAQLEITQEDIESMIDLSLATNDKQWFEELTETLNTMKTLEELF
jgi:hypothetical protein